MPLFRCGLIQDSYPSPSRTATREKPLMLSLFHLSFTFLCISLDRIGRREFKWYFWQGLLFFKRYNTSFNRKWPSKRIILGFCRSYFVPCLKRPYRKGNPVVPYPSGLISNPSNYYVAYHEKYVIMRKFVQDPDSIRVN